MPQAVEHDAGELRVCILPLEELLTNQHRLDCQTVGQTEQHSAVTVAFRVFCFVRCHLPQPLLQLFFQSRGHEDRAAGRCGLGAFQDERSGAALQLVRENLDDTAIIHLIQGFLPHPLHGFVDVECSDAIGGIEVNIIGGQTNDLALSQRTDQSEVDCQM